jgi:hypothetical protein
MAITGLAMLVTGYVSGLALAITSVSVAPRVQAR